MNLEEIKTIVNNDNLNSSMKESLIISSLASDKRVIPIIMKMLNVEREENRTLIMDMNLELSRAHIYIDERPESKTEAKQSFNKNFILDEIAAFYIKNKKRVTHCFNRFIKSESNVD